MTTTDYLKQATDFLELTNTTLAVNYSKHDYHFINDTDRRDIYYCILKRGDKTFSFKFGDSVANSTKIPKITPNAYDILSCLTTYDVGDFKDFCADFGYNEYNDFGETDKDNLRIYNMVVREYKGLSNLFNEEELSILNDIR